MANINRNKGSKYIENRVKLLLFSIQSLKKKNNGANAPLSYSLSYLRFELKPRLSLYPTLPFKLIR
jgi:hypothetical protein